MQGAMRRAAVFMLATSAACGSKEEVAGASAATAPTKTVEAPAVKPKAAGWQIESQTDAMTDAVVTSARVVGLPSREGLRGAPPSLTLMCDAGGVKLAVVADLVEAFEGSANARVRFDEMPARFMPLLVRGRSTWMLSLVGGDRLPNADGVWPELPKDRKIDNFAGDIQEQLRWGLMTMVTASKLKLELDTVADGVQVFEFSMEGAKATLDRVRKGCPL